jgi:uncharacterized protein
MIVYSATKKIFLEHTQSNQIHLKILNEVKRLRLSGGGDSEVTSWRNSMKFMADVLNDSAIADDVRVSIEYKVPSSSKRIDFIVTGKDGRNNESAVIIELKQWSKVRKTKKDGVVESFVGGKSRELLHPSYQAWTYASLIKDFNETVRNESIGLHPCAYLHNLDSLDSINDPQYKFYTDKAPVFISQDAEKLNRFLKQFVRYSDSSDIMYRIEHGKIRPSKSLADSISSMLKGNREFILIDSQKLIAETVLQCVSLMAQVNDAKKTVIIVQGGPGTGKSVVAINLLVDILKKGKIANYVTKNQAPRDVYSTKLKGAKSKKQIDNLFKGSASYTGVDPNSIDVLLIDEAHRLMAKNRYNSESENQIKELIRAAKLAVFFIDEDQTVHWQDVGDRESIRTFAHEFGAEVFEYELESQFRCNGSDGYLAWLDNTLDINETANRELANIEYQFEVLDNPNELKQKILSKNVEANKARMVAGYCWDWISKGGSGKQKNIMDIVMPEYDFSAQWNLTDDGFLWITANDSVEQVGCIHTCQGLELDYVGVIIGPDLIVRDGQVITDPKGRSSMDASIKGYKKLFKEDEELARKKADSIIKNTYRTLMTRGQKGCYLFCTDRETNNYFKERINAFTNSKEPAGLVVPASQIPFNVIDNPKDLHSQCVPVFDIKVAAGEFSPYQNTDDYQWIELPSFITKQDGMFVMQVIGESMNKHIPNGAWCLFKSTPGGTRNGKIVLVQYRGIEDPDLGGSFTIKRYHSEKIQQDEYSLNQRIVLSPESTAFGYCDIVITDPEEDFSVIGEFLAKL